jgi:hypothetical protein
MSSSNTSSAVANSTAPGAQTPIYVTSYASVAVKSHVPMTLELNTSNFTKWSAYFHAMCGKLGLLRHLDDPVPAADVVDATWEQADCCVRSWIFGSIEDPVLDMAMDGTTQTTCQLWVTIEALFQVNKASRAIFLSHEFHSMTQGDSLIDEYCLRVKTTVDKLHNIGEPVSESTLVLNPLRGLNEPYANTADHIAATNLTFSYARDQLILNELRLANGEKVATGTTLLVGSPSSCGGCGCQSSGGGQQKQQPPRNSGQRRNNKKGGKKSYGGRGGGYDGYGAGCGQHNRPPVASGSWVCMSLGN